jgi:hypothetical protein
MVTPASASPACLTPSLRSWTVTGSYSYAYTPPGDVLDLAMKLLDILRRRGVPNPEQIVAEYEKPPLEPWWNSKARWEKELGRKLP